MSFLSWCFSIKQKGLKAFLIYSLRVHLTTTGCLSEYEKPAHDITQCQRGASYTWSYNQPLDCLTSLNLKSNKLNLYDDMWFFCHDCELKLKIYMSNTVRQLNIVTVFFCWPDGLWVDVDRSDPLQQKLHHFQERIGGLFWECQLPSDLPLQGVKTDIFMDTHRLQGVATHLHRNILSTYLTSCSNKIVFSLTNTPTCKKPSTFFTLCRLKTQTHS